MKRRLFLIGILSLAFISCLALPKPAEDPGTLLVIPVTAENTSSLEVYLANYHLFLREYDPPIVITPRNGYVFVKDLRADTIYNAEKIKTVINQMRISPGDLKYLTAAVWTKKGHITIFPYRLDIVQEPHPVLSNPIIQRLSLHLLLRAEKEQIARDLSRYRNYELWSSVQTR